MRQSSRHKPYLTLIVLCIALTVLDIAVVELHYRPLTAWNRIWVWHALFLWCAALAPAVACYFLKSLVPLGTWLYFLFGLEDRVFYGLQGYLPVRYWGVHILGVWEPALVEGLLFNLVGVVVIGVYLFANLSLKVTLPNTRR